MAATKYTKSISSDFPNHKVATDRLAQDVRNSAITTALDYINTSGDDCDIWFKAELSSGDVGVLSGLCLAHLGEALLNEMQQVQLPGQQKLDNATLVALAPREGIEVVKATHNLCDKTTWFQGSARIEGELLSSLDDLTYTSLHDWWVDLVHGKVYEEEQAEGYGVGIYVDGVEQQSGFEIDYILGSLTFEQSQNGKVVTADYSYAGSSEWRLAPYPGRVLCVEKAEVQLTDDLDLTSPFLLELWGFVDVFAPEMAESNGGPVPNGTQIKLGSAVYRNVAQILDEAKGSYPPIPPLGGVGGLKHTMYVFPFVYLATKELHSNYGMEYRIYVEGDVAFGGERATATFYCMCREEVV